MQTIKLVHWQDGDAFLAYLLNYPQSAAGTTCPAFYATAPRATELGPEATTRRAKMPENFALYTRSCDALPAAQMLALADVVIPTHADTEARIDLHIYLAGSDHNRQRDALEPTGRAPARFRRFYHSTRLPGLPCLSVASESYGGSGKLALSSEWR